MLKSLTVFIVMVVTGFSAFVSCDNDPEGKDLYLIQIDSVGVPDQILSSDTLEASFWGFVGGDGCHMFSHFDVRRNPEEYAIEVFGLDTRESICTTELVFLRGEILSVDPPHDPGLLFLVVHQPDGSETTSPVMVIE